MSFSVASVPKVAVVAVALLVAVLVGGTHAQITESGIMNSFDTIFADTARGIIKEICRVVPQQLCNVMIQVTEAIIKAFVSTTP
ncbi:hypothetical protein R5R35_014831 [Gryllus longicercus]|uniref:Accessory gland protein n=1 Tax=Gryllus longicercus TaxID=2509291 RepID=A0AAN9YXX6_9ORTH